MGCLNASLLRDEHLGRLNASLLRDEHLRLLMRRHGHSLQPGGLYLHCTFSRIDDGTGLTGPPQTDHDADDEAAAPNHNADKDHNEEDGHRSILRDVGSRRWKRGS